MHEKVLDFLNQATCDGVFPAAHALVFHGDSILFDEIVGHAQITDPARILKRHHFFDIASLTKPLVTATLCLIAHQEKKMDLNDPIKSLMGILPGITPYHLLTHTAGLPAWEPLYKKYEHAPLNPDKTKQEIIAQIGTIAAIPDSRTCYSDLGFIILGALLEKIYNIPLEKLFVQKIALPFDLDDTFYNPILNKKVVDENLFVATEECIWRNKLLSGEVMDDNAWVMGGIAGHAGIFSKAGDIFRWIRHLKNGLDGKNSLLDQKTTTYFLKTPPPSKRPAFALGFDTPSVDSSSGKYFSENTVGHLAYTGCSFWWDLEKDCGVILLTNRVHPSRNNDKIKNFRPLFHDFVWKHLLKA